MEVSLSEILHYFKITKESDTFCGKIALTRLTSTMSDNVKVAVKIRPLIKRENSKKLPVQWKVNENTIFPVDPEIRRRSEYSHIFDHIFGMDKKNADIFDAIVRPIVEATVNGFNGTVLAYGQTGAGKTHTMMGGPKDLGIIPLAIENMFHVIANTSDKEFLLRVSYLEIYNEKINDLLEKNGVDLKINEDVNGQIMVKCEEEIVNCPQDLLNIMKKGNKSRKIDETNMNERTSRSHTIFRITIESRRASSAVDSAVLISQLNLVDLAGSEQTRQTGATGDKLKEGKYINLSLSSLGLVILQLSECKEHVNFRDSKLTRILKASLGGNTVTAIICAVTPAALDETQCTLAFASRAKTIRNKPKINKVMSDAALLKQYSQEIAKLSAELERERQTNREAEVEKMESKLQEKDEYENLIKFDDTLGDWELGTPRRSEEKNCGELRNVLCPYSLEPNDRERQTNREAEVEKMESKLQEKDEYENLIKFDDTLGDWKLGTPRRSEEKNCRKLRNVLCPYSLEPNDIASNDEKCTRFDSIYHTLMKEVEALRSENRILINQLTYHNTSANNSSTKKMESSPSGPSFLQVPTPESRKRAQSPGNQSPFRAYFKVPDMAGCYKATCLLCQAQISLPLATSNLSRHLRRKHFREFQGTLDRQ